MFELSLKEVSMKIDERRRVFRRMNRFALSNGLMLMALLVLVGVLLSVRH
jgi:hypothetical protein